MPELKVPEWLPDFVHELGTYLRSRVHREAAGAAGTLTFFRDGMLAPLRKIAKGEGTSVDQKVLQERLDASEEEVNLIIGRLDKAKKKLAGTAGSVEFAMDIDDIIRGSFGKVGIRDRIEDVIRGDLSMNYLSELAKEVCNEIEGFNHAVARLGRKAERWGID